MCVCVRVCAQIKAAAKSDGGEIPGKKKLYKPWRGEKTEIRYSILFGCVTTLDRIC